MKDTLNEYYADAQRFSGTEGHDGEYYYISGLDDIDGVKTGEIDQMFTRE